MSRLQEHKHGNQTQEAEDARQQAEEAVLIVKSARRQAKVRKVMHEYKEGILHSGSKTGPTVKSRKQAVAIAMSEAGKRK